MKITTPLKADEDLEDSFVVVLPTGQEIMTGFDFFSCRDTRRYQVLCYVHGEDEPQVAIRYNADGSIAEVAVRKGLPVIHDVDASTAWYDERDGRDG